MVEVLKDQSSDSSVPRSIRQMVELEQREKVRMSLSDHLADSITRFAGSMTFVWLNLGWFVVWIVLNTLVFTELDPFPFGLLTMIVSLEAIGLAIFVLISENRQASLADKRAKLDLQVNLIAEEEVTKLIEIVARIERRLGSTDASDPEVSRMRAPTNVGEIADKMEAYERAVDSDVAAAPKSAIDSQA